MGSVCDMLGVIGQAEHKLTWAHFSKARRKIHMTEKNTKLASAQKYQGRPL